MIDPQYFIGFAAKFVRDITRTAYFVCFRGLSPLSQPFPEYSLRFIHEVFNAEEKAPTWAGLNHSHKEAD